MTTSIAQVETSNLVRILMLSHNGVEVWPDERFHEDGFDYFWICSNVAGTACNLAYVRLKPGAFEKRTYDQNGNDLWVATD